MVCHTYEPTHEMFYFVRDSGALYVPLGMSITQTKETVKVVVRCEVME